MLRIQEVEKITIFENVSLFFNVNYRKKMIVPLKKTDLPIVFVKNVYSSQIKFV